jgi:hypothetical protein
MLFFALMIYSFVYADTFSEDEWYKKDPDEHEEEANAG